MGARPAREGDKVGEGRDRAWCGGGGGGRDAWLPPWPRLQAGELAGGEVPEQRAERQWEGWAATERTELRGGAGTSSGAHEIYPENFLRPSIFEIFEGLKPIRDRLGSV